MLETGPHVKSELVAVESRTLGEMFRRRVQLSGETPAMYAKEGGSAWVKTTWSMFHERAAQVAKGLLDLGLERGDRVAILGPTQKPWAFQDMGSQLAGMIGLGIYPKQAVDQIKYLVEHSDTRVIFVTEDEEIENVIAACSGNDEVVAIVPWTEEEFERYHDRDPRITSPKDFAGEPLAEDEQVKIQDELDPEDTAILIYTSGTTGKPKGAMITHGNVLALLSSQRDVLDIWKDDISLSFLPMAHAAERVLAFYGRINCGFATAYATNVASVLTEVQEVRPTVFGSVPRIFEKAYGVIQNELSKKPKPVQRLAAWAVGVGKRRLRYVLNNKPAPFLLELQYRVADKIIFEKVRNAFGGRVRVCLVGAAPTAREILEFFWAAGFPLYEVYGMTESTVISHANQPKAIRLGTVGKPITPMEQRIADDGEVLMRGPFVFKGYFKNEEGTAETIIDGWLHTGDIGSIDDDGFLRITDRKKHLIITAGGKNLTPANIENAIKNQSPLIHQVHAHGDQRPYISAIIAPSPIETLELGVELGLVTKSELEERTKELMDNPTGRTDALNQATAKVVSTDRYKQAVLEAVQRGNKSLARVETVRRFRILDRDFSQEAGEMTPTMKLKRKTVETKYTEIFDRIYDEDGFATNV